MHKLLILFKVYFCRLQESNYVLFRSYGRQKEKKKVGKNAKNRYELERLTGYRYGREIPKIRKRE